MKRCPEGEKNLRALGSAFATNVRPNSSTQQVAGRNKCDRTPQNKSWRFQNVPNETIRRTTRQESHFAQAMKVRSRLHWRSETNLFEALGGVARTADEDHGSLARILGRCGTLSVHQHQRGQEAFGYRTFPLSKVRQYDRKK